MSNRSLVKKAAYVFQERNDAVLNIRGVDAELNFALKTQQTY